MTITHYFPPIMPGLAHFSYGMIAPYQRDTWINADLAVIGWDAEGRSTLVPVRQYFVGAFGERNSRMRLEQFSGLSPTDFAKTYVPMLSQIQEHERDQGRSYVQLDLYFEKWRRSLDGYEASRMQSDRHFVLTFP